MGINISQFNPPGTVSNLVWDDDMEAGAGKIFKGDLTGNVTGDVSGYLTRPGYFANSAGSTGVLFKSVDADNVATEIGAGSVTGEEIFNLDTSGLDSLVLSGDVFKLLFDSSASSLVCSVTSYIEWTGNGGYLHDVYTSYDADDNIIDTISFDADYTQTHTFTGTLDILGAVKIVCQYSHHTDGGATILTASTLEVGAYSVYAFKDGAV